MHTCTCTCTIYAYLIAIDLAAIFYNQGIIDSFIKRNSSTGVLIKASKYDVYYQQIKNNIFFSRRSGNICSIIIHKNTL